MATDVEIPKPISSGATDEPDAEQAATAPPLPEGYSRGAVVRQQAPPLPVGYRRGTLTPTATNAAPKPASGPTAMQTHDQAIADKVVQYGKGLANSIGVPESGSEYKAAAEDANKINLPNVARWVGGPAADLALQAYGSGKQALKRIVESGHEAYEAGQNIAQGGPVLQNLAKPAASLVEANVGAVPFVGEPTVQAGKDIAAGNKAHAAGELTGAIGQIVVPELHEHIFPGEPAKLHATEVKQMESNVANLAKDREVAQTKYDAALAEHNKHTASHAQGIGSPEKVVKEVTKTKDALDEAVAHHELAKEALAKKIAAGPPKAAPKSVTAAPEVPAEQIEARPTLTKLGEKKSPYAVSPAHATTTVPQEPTAAPRPSYGRIELAGGQGTMGKPLQLTEGTPEGPQVPKEGMPKIKLPEAAPTRPETDEASLRALEAKKGVVTENIPKKVHELLKESLKTDTDTNKNFPATKVEEEPAKAPATEEPAAPARVKRAAEDRRQETTPVEEERRTGPRRNHAGVRVDEYGNPVLSPDVQNHWQSSVFGEKPVEDIGSKAREENPEPTRAETKTKPVLPKEEPTGYEAKKEELVPVGEEGREPATPAAEYHPEVRQRVFELGNEDLKALARAHGLNPDAPEYAFGKGVKRTEATATSSGRQQTGRVKLADDVTAQMSDDEKINIGRNARTMESEGTFKGQDVSNASRAEQARKLFPRLNAEETTGGYGSKNTGVTKEAKDAAVKSFNDKATRSNAGFDPTMLADAAKVAAYHIEAGARAFADFSAKMVEDFGEGIRPYLKDLHTKVSGGSGKITPKDFLEEVENHPDLHFSSEYEGDLENDKGTTINLKAVSNPDRVRISDLQSSDKGKGGATDMLKTVTKLADKHGMALELTASPYGDESTRLNHEQLRAFYEKHGFIPEKGKDEALGYMVREPKTPQAVSGGAPETTVGNKEEADRDTEHFANAKKELGTNASISDIAKRQAAEAAEKTPEGYHLETIKVPPAGDDYSPAVAKKYAALDTDFPPIKMKEDGTIEDGNHRAAAAKLRGDKTIKAFVPDNYNPTEEESVLPAQEMKDAHAQLAAHEANGGSTFSSKGKDLNGTDKYSVGAYPDRTEQVDKLTPERLEEFKNKNSDVLSKEDHAIGTWKDPDTGKAVLDVTKLYDGKDEAIAAGKAANQKAIYHLGGEGEIQTGGTGTPEPSAANAKLSDEELIKKGFTKEDIENGKHLPAVSGGSGEKKLPTGDQLIKKYGESDGDPAHTTFILPDGRGVANTGIEHDRMLGGTPTDRVPPRERFVEQGNIRVRPRSGGKAGREVALSIPESGITTQQLDNLKKMAPQLGSGSVLIEIGKRGGDYRVIPYGEASDKLESIIRELAPIKNEKGAPIDEFGNPTVSGGSQSAGTGTAKEVELPELAEKHLTPEERASVTKSGVGAKNFTENFAKLPPLQEWIDAAKAGEGARHWYQRSGKAFDALHEVAPEYFKKGDREKFGNFVAALSPRQMVHNNLGEALNAWKQWVDDGRPTGKDMEKSLRDSIASAPTTKIPNAMKALSGEEMWPTLSNRYFKVPSFGKNLNQYLNFTTNDGWQALFGGLNEKEVGNPSSYHPLSVMTRAAAEALGWEPAEAQSAIWSFTQSLKERGETNPHEVRAYSEDFADIMAHNQQIRQQLKNLGVDLGKLDERLEAIGEKPEITAGASRTSEHSARELAARIEAARGEGSIPAPKTGNLFREAPAREGRVRDEATRFNPEEFENEKPSLEKLGEKKKKSPYGNVR